MAHISNKKNDDDDSLFKSYSDLLN
jgi:hypothetical protein